MKELFIQITEDDYKVLKDNGYVLCVAKKVEDCDFNVIWRAEADFAQRNSITWEDKYSIFVSRTIKKGQLVFINVPPCEISPGQKVTLEKEFCFGTVEPFENVDEIAMVNQYKPVYPGLCQECTDFSGVTESTPFYLSPDLSIPGTFTAKLAEQLLVWFAQGGKSGLIISQNRNSHEEKTISNCVKLDMSAKDKVNLTFEGFQWKITN